MKNVSKDTVEQILNLSKGYRSILHYFFRCSRNMREMYQSISHICRETGIKKTTVMDFLRKNPNLISRTHRHRRSSFYRISSQAVECIKYLEREGVWNMNRRQRLRWWHVQKPHLTCSKTAPHSSSYSEKNCSPAEAKQASSPIVDPAITLLNLPRSAQQILVKIGMNAFELTNETIKAKGKRKEPIHDLEAYACHIFSKRLRRVTDRVIRSL